MQYNKLVLAFDKDTPSIFSNSFVVLSNVKRCCSERCSLSCARYLQVYSQPSSLHAIVFILRIWFHCCVVVVCACIVQSGFDTVLHRTGKRIYCFSLRRLSSFDFTD